MASIYTAMTFALAGAGAALCLAGAAAAARLGAAWIGMCGLGCALLAGLSAIASITGLP